MSRQEQTKRIRLRKLGVLIYDARISTRKTIEECSLAIGVDPETYKMYEQGELAPSLPELELLAFFFEIPVEQFWNNTAISEANPHKDTINTDRILPLRQRMIGAQLRQARENCTASIDELSAAVGIPSNTLEAYELGDVPIPLVDLETISSTLEISLSTFFDQHGPIALWRKSKESFQHYSELSPEIQNFIAQPVNRPYLEVAQRLSSLSAERLRAVAEGILEITY